MKLNLETIRGQLATVKNQYKKDVIFNNSEIKYAVSMLGTGGRVTAREGTMWSVSNYCGCQGQPKRVTFVFSVQGSVLCFCFSQHLTSLVSQVTAAF